MKTILQEHAVLVLTGPPGVGKHTTALRLLVHCLSDLHLSSDPRENIRNIRMGWDEVNPNTLSQLPGQGFLLNLVSGDDDNDYPSSGFAEELIDDSRAMRMNACFLVVTATEQVWSHGARAVPQITRNVLPPSGRRVVEGRLKAMGLADRIGLLDSPALADFDTSSSFSAAVQLANAIANAPGILDPEEIAKHAADEVLNWKPYVQTWFREHTSVTERATLVAAAALEPGTPSEVVQARDELLSILGYEVENYGPLAGPGLTGHLEVIGASPTKDGYKISEERKGLDEAILDFVWDEWPRLHDPFVDWLMSVAGTSKRNASKIASTVAGMALRKKSTAFLDFIRKLVSVQPGSEELAAGIIDLTVFDPDVGAKVRKRLLSWASGESDVLATVSADACGRALGREQPLLALKRLCQVLGRYNEGKATQAGRKALISLAKDPELRYEVVSHVVGWMNSSPVAGLRGFLGIIEDTSQELPKAILRDAIEGDPAPVALLQKGWIAACETGGNQAHIARALKSFVRCAEEINAPFELIREIALPVLSNSYHVTLLARVLGGSNTSDDSLEFRLLKELIGRNLQYPHPGPCGVTGD